MYKVEWIDARTGKLSSIEVSTIRSVYSTISTLQRRPDRFLYVEVMHSGEPRKLNPIKFTVQS